MFVGPPDDPHRYQVDRDNVLSASGGAEGTVYRGVRTSDECPVALKCLVHVRPAELAGTWDRLRVIGRAHHPALMRLIEAFVGSALSDDEAGTLAAEDFDVCWLVSEWIPESLESALRTKDPGWRLFAAAELADAVAALHEERTVTGMGRVASLHRDIKPSNIRVRADGTVALVDFGLAGPADDSAPGTGTRGWQAPEVALGGSATPASDVWAVGAVAMYVVTGKRPTILDDDKRALSAALADHPNRRALVDLLLEPLDRVPARRPTTIGSWAGRLRQAALAGQPRRIGVAKLIVAALVGALVLVAVLVATSWRREPTVNEVGPCPPPTLPPTPAGRKVADALAKLDVCVGKIEAVQDLVAAQLLDWERNPLAGVVLATSETGPFHLSQGQWYGYALLGYNLGLSIDLAGYPVSVNHLSNPNRWEIELSRSGVLIGPYVDSEVYWVPSQTRYLWEESGGPSGLLGFPMAHPTFVAGRLTQDFERGYMATDAVQLAPDPLPKESVDIVYVSSDQAKAGLAKLGDIRRRIVQVDRGGSWVIDDRGRRRWINWGGMFACMGDSPKVITRTMRGFELAALPLGPIADCPLTATAERDPAAEAEPTTTL